MNDLKNFRESGFAIVENLYTEKEVASILATIEDTDTGGTSFRKSDSLFAIRRFLKEIPAVIPIVFNTGLRTFIAQHFGENYAAVKSIYFDKPGNSNWFVAYHQDLTIGVESRTGHTGYGPWTVKQDQFAVQPPLDILEDMFTIRIHLDDTDEHNGALKVVPGSHLKGICRAETIKRNTDQVKTCSVPKGGIMLMKPLLLHGSERTRNNKQRRVIHIEFSRQELPEGMQWAERI